MTSFISFKVHRVLFLTLLDLRVLDLTLLEMIGNKVITIYKVKTTYKVKTKYKGTTFLKEM